MQDSEVMHTQLNLKLNGHSYTFKHTSGCIEIKYTKDFYSNIEVVIDNNAIPIRDAYLLRIKELISDCIISDEAKLR